MYVIPGPSLTPSIAFSIAPWSIAGTIHRSLIHRPFYCSIIGRLHKTSLFLLLHDSRPASFIAPSILPNLTLTLHYSFDYCLINRSHHPLYIQIIPDASLEPSIAPSIDLWSITCTIYCSFECSLINHLHHPLSLRMFPDASLAPSIATSISQYDLFIICERYNERIVLSNRRSEG
jgi:hypothetical protein